MPTPRFDPGGFYEFNLAQGAVRTRGGERVVVVSEQTLTALLGAADAAGTLGSFGKKLGAHAKQSLGGSASDASPESVMGHAASVLALFGLGRLTLQRWGDAMVLTASSAPDLGPRGMSDILAAFFSELSGRSVGCVRVGDDAYLMSDPEIADAVSGWAKQGASVAEIVSRLKMEAA